MEPMLLPEVESNPQPGPYHDVIQANLRAGREYPQIWHLFAYRPQATDHLSRFTQEIMRGPASISPGLRELIAAYTSYRNNTQFCFKSHAAVAAELLENEDLVWSVLRDFERSPLEEREKVLFRFIEKVHRDAVHITQADMQQLNAAGWDDEAIYIAITVCALFNFYNRWIDATGVHPLSEEGHREGGKRMAEHGYLRK